MAVSVINGGPFVKTEGQRPGLYVRFVEKAIAAISTGARSKVATVKLVWDTTNGMAEDGKVYRVKNMTEARALFGADYVDDIRYMLIGGASEVIISVIDGSAQTPDYTGALQRLETYEFHVFVLPPGFPDELDTEAYTWLKTCRANGMSFIAVFSKPSAEGNKTALKTAARVRADEYAVFVGGGVKNTDGTDVPADKYACYIAGLIARTPLDGSLTYYEVPFTEVITRWRTVDVKDLLANGILVTVMDGDQPRIEQGLTLGDTSKGEFNKIRTVRAKQAMIDDIDRAVNDNYIGKITNSPDGQIAVINAIKTYLQTLANNNIIADDFVVELDKTTPSVGDELYINIIVRFLDSIEYVYLTITVQ